MGFKLCIIAASSNALFQSRATEQRQNEKICQDIDDVSGEDYETETLRRRKIGERSQKAGPISELGVLHPRADWNLAKSSAQISSLISAAVRGVAPMLVQGSASISDKLLPQSKDRAANWQFHVAAQSPN